MKEYIPREKYIERVRPFMGTELIKVFTGQRRVGKSYLLYELMDMVTGAGSEVIYINKELGDFDGIRDYRDLYGYIKKQKHSDGKTAVFIDEIQEVVQFEKALRSLAAEGGYDLYCTGSNAMLLSGELATLLSGRYIEIRVFPLTYAEFLVFRDLPDSSEALEHYLKYGGLPYLKNLPLDDDVVFDYLKNVYEAILYRDVVGRYGVRNVGFLERLVGFLAHHTGSLFSARNIVRYLKSQEIRISVSALLDYLGYLANAFFIVRVGRSDIRGKKIFEVGEKYYFTDVGLRNVIAGYSPFEKGMILENVVFSHLLSCGYKVFVGKTGEKEIDFIAEKGGERVYIQVALYLNEESTVKREFGNLMQIKDNYPKYVITMDKSGGVSYQGIRHLPLREFLLNFE